MRYLLVLLVLLPLLVHPAKYCSPTGSDDNAGTYAAPYFTITKAFSVVSAGDTIYMRGGTYSYTDPQLNRNYGTTTGVSGSAGATIKLWNYPGEVPVITKSVTWSYANSSADGYGSNLLYFRNVSYIHVSGLELCWNTQADAYMWRGFFGTDIHHCLFENLNVHHNGCGFGVGQNSYQITVLNCDFHHNYDPSSSTPYGNGDGCQFAYITSTDTNFVTGSRSYRNADDGFDAHHSACVMVYSDSWSFHNGYQSNGTTAAGNGMGFKLGDSPTDALTSVKRIVKNCLAAYNRDIGFDQNNGFFRMVLYNNTSAFNGGSGYVLSYDDATKPINMTLTNCLSYGNGGVLAYVNRNGTLTTNTFKFSTAPSTTANTDLCTVTLADFVSTDSTGISGSRQSNHSLPGLSFLHFAAGSDLIDVGTSVGISYNGSGPDLGAFEYGVTVLQESSGKVIKTGGRVVKQAGKLIKY